MKWNISILVYFKPKPLDCGSHHLSHNSERLENILFSLYSTAGNQLSLESCLLHVKQARSFFLL